MTITAEEASTKFLSILDQMTDGEPVTITRQGVPVASLVSANETEMLTPSEANKRLDLLQKSLDFSIRGRRPYARDLLNELRKGVRPNGMSTER